MQKPFCKNIAKVSLYHCQNINVMLKDDQSFNCVVTFNGMDYFSNQKSKKLGEQDLASQIIANLNLS